MIPENPSSVQRLLPISEVASSWNEQLQQMLTTLAELQDYLMLKDPPAALDDAIKLDFPVRTTRFFADLMQPGDWHDPLLRQVLPWGVERERTPGFGLDPLAELKATPTPGLIHKYGNRALVLPTSACAIHCRYCFRRHFPYAEHRLSINDKKALLSYLDQKQQINEVILSGGDPLMLSDHQLTLWLQDLANLTHIKRLRIHSRLPIVLPDRLTDSLLNTLTHSRLQIILVLHANHPREISMPLQQRLKSWQSAGITLLNQSVLLGGVNDDPEVLAALSESLFEAGILPYYLHLLDPVQGAAHFDVPEPKAQHIHRELQRLCPGFLVPRLVREEPGEVSKTWRNESA